MLYTESQGNKKSLRFGGFVPETGFEPAHQYLHITFIYILLTAFSSTHSIIE